MKTTEVLQQIDIPRAKLYYLELKGYIHPRRIPRGDQEIRDYSQRDVSMIKSIWMYLKKGYKLKMAYRKALQKLNRANHGKLQNWE